MAPHNQAGDVSYRESEGRAGIEVMQRLSRSVLQVEWGTLDSDVLHCTAKGYNARDINLWGVRDGVPAMGINSSKKRVTVKELHKEKARLHMWRCPPDAPAAASLERLSKTVQFHRSRLDKTAFVSPPVLNWSRYKFAPSWAEPPPLRPPVLQEEMALQLNLLRLAAKNTMYLATSMASQITTEWETGQLILKKRFNEGLHSAPRSSEIGSKSSHAAARLQTPLSPSPRTSTTRKDKLQKDAGAISGLRVLRIMNEPTAAAIAYGLDKTESKNGGGYVLIFDLGGGTFDVTLMTIERGVFDVKATAGNTHLGGEDFDNRLIDHFTEEFKKKHGKDIKDNQRSLRRLRTACERAKRALSSSTQSSIEVDSLYQGIDFYTSITRAKFEDLCHDLFSMCMAPLRQVFLDSKIDKKDVCEVVLVGGSTRIPRVRDMISGFFNGKELNKSINPDEAVAFGAAVQAFILTGGQSQLTGDILLLDVAPFSTGIETSDGVMTTVTQRNTTIPVKKSHNLTGTHIKVYEGDRAMTKDCRFLGRFDLSGIPPASQSEPQIEVTFGVDADGILSVSAEDGKSQVSIANDKERLSQAEIDKMRTDAKKLTEADRLAKERMDCKNTYESYARTTKAAVLNEEVQTFLSADEKNLVVKACSDALVWLDTLQEASKEEYSSRLHTLEGVCKPIVCKMSHPVEEIN